MKVAINWLKELVEIKEPMEKVAQILGDKTVAVKELSESSMELDMKGYNRSDLLSLRGVAYEVAAVTNSKVKFDEMHPDSFYWVEKSLGQTPVEIDEEICELQCVAKIEGLKVERSSEEWKKKLEASGMRPVNNIVDATNLIMLEYGQPLHAFDAATVKDDTIIVRRAKEGEDVVTLDGKKRKLTSEDMVLADREKALDVAGVMGGKDTEISESTTTILLSASFFNPSMVRKTATRLGLLSEASKRFYHGLTKKRLFQALDGAIRMYESLGGKVTALKIVGDSEDQVKKIPLSLGMINNLIGISISEEKVEEYLKALNFKFDFHGNKEGEAAWVVTPPYYRLDISIEEDLVEEVARMYGYEKIPATELPKINPVGSDQRIFELISNLNKELSGLGLSEVQTYSFYSTKVLESQGFLERDLLKHLIKIKNPISAETEYLRMSVWPNLVEAASKNIRNGTKDLGIFEIGKSYTKSEDGEIKEDFELAVLISYTKGDGMREIYEVYKRIAEILGLPEELEVSAPPSFAKHLFHPKKFLSIFKGELLVGGMAQVHPRVVNKFGVEQRMAVIGINLSSFSSTNPAEPEHGEVHYE